MVKNFDSTQMDPSRSMSNLPSELLRDILARLSSEDLMLFRCVCSSWRNIIDCPMFSLLHPSSFLPKNLILSSRFGCYKLSFEKITPSTTLGNEPIPAKVVRIKNPITHGHEIRCLSQANNGLVLLIDVTTHEVFVWNPFTRWHHKLPLCDLIKGFEKNVNYGIGFDELSKDFKVVLIRHHLHASPDVFVHKLRSNTNNPLTLRCWKPKEDLPMLRFHNFSRGHSGVFVNGAFHWVVRHDEYFTKKSVLVVDIGTEKYRLIPFPQICDDYFSMQDLCVSGGCLCVTSRPRFNQFEAWVMQEYGVVESWSRLYVVTHNILIEAPYVRPVAYSNCGRWVLLWYGDGLLVSSSEQVS